MRGMQPVASSLRGFRCECVPQFIDKQRLQAHLEKTNRPWDGIDGEDFKAWKVRAGRPREFALLRCRLLVAAAIPHRVCTEHVATATGGMQGS